MTIELTGRTVAVLDWRTASTNKEYAILEMLALHKGRTVTKQAFIAHIYNDRDDPAVVATLLVPGAGAEAASCAASNRVGYAVTAVSYRESHGLSPFAGSTVTA